VSLPVERNQILEAKFKSCLVCGTEFGFALAVVLAIGALTSGISVYVWPIALIFANIARAFAVKLGIWLSMICGSTVQANIWLIIILLGLGALPNLIAELAITLTRSSLGANERELFWFFLVEMGPIAAWSTFTATWRELDPDTQGVKLAWRLLAASCGGVGMIMLSSLCWFDARRRFEREGRR
jgi:hypothetical protein